MTHTAQMGIDYIDHGEHAARTGVRCGCMCESRGCQLARLPLTGAVSGAACRCPRHCCVCVQEVPLLKKIIFSGLSGAIATTCIYPIDIWSANKGRTWLARGGDGAC
jgi:hypothetical protein